jgi:hypothetical protein|tara:strand:+ start:90 stop:1076 length:987 start_codon:yes stop_codon:yes gene_type:complete
MCLIVRTNDSSTVKENLIKSAYENNSDGFGIMYLKKDRIHTQKIVPKSSDDIVQLFDKYRDMKIPMGLHWRFTTTGSSDKGNCHPFSVLNTEQHGRDVFLMHNGAKLPTPMIDKDKSDTHQYVKYVLRPMLSNNPDLLYNADWQEMIADSIGSDKLLFLDSKTKKFTIINEDEGETLENNMWLSNTYSLSRGMGMDYDPVTDTLSNNIMPYGNSSIWNSKSYKPTYGTRSDDDWGWDDMYSMYDKGYDYDKETYKPQSSTFEISKDGELYNLADLYGATEDEINEVVKRNPSGTSDMLHDLVYATQDEIYDSVAELEQLKSNSKGGNR